MLIAEVAEILQLAPHVLRHWEDQGVVVASRSPNGYREYDDEALTRLRVVKACREAGVSLPRIRVLLHRDEAGRAEVIRDERARVTTQLAELRSTLLFLDHVLGCRHSLMSRCHSCSRFAGR